MVNLRFLQLLLIPFLLVSSACSTKSDGAKLVAMDSDSTTQHTTFAMGCFWHSEEIFLEIKGVKDAEPGYCGGTEPNPSYDLVGSGSTRYAESVDVTFDPSQISYQKLLEVFFAEHDPTTKDRQGPDAGPQYRSAIFYHSPEQQQEAESYIHKIASNYTSSVVTEVAPFSKFWRAEDYHIHYFRNHPDQPYIAAVTRPEVEKFRKDFPELLK
ncbi:MAG TPA: peptide-methionine (S)-S-oxide reductase MsrA [Candidatus Kapabacteria bacterium]|nr:peptide-methionine (S)-S-oxide reductase MsrA [Candidatus Kapabacteria bacterium]